MDTTNYEYRLANGYGHQWHNTAWLHKAARQAKQMLLAKRNSGDDFPRITLGPFEWQIADGQPCEAIPSGPWSWDGKPWDYDSDQEAPWLVDNSGEPIIAGQIRCSQKTAKLLESLPDVLACIDFVALEEIAMELFGITQLEQHQAAEKLRSIAAKQRAAIVKATM